MIGFSEGLVDVIYTTTGDFITSSFKNDVRLFGVLTMLFMLVMAFVGIKVCVGVCVGVWLCVCGCVFVCLYGPQQWAQPRVCVADRS